MTHHRSPNGSEHWGSPGLMKTGTGSAISCTVAWSQSQFLAVPVPVFISPGQSPVNGYVESKRGNAECQEFEEETFRRRWRGTISPNRRPDRQQANGACIEGGYVSVCLACLLGSLTCDLGSTKLSSNIPPSQREVVRSRRCTPLGIDEIGHLNRLEAWHFMVAGPEGALVTEYGTFHDMDGLRFSNPKASL